MGSSHLLNKGMPLGKQRALCFDVRACLRVCVCVCVSARVQPIFSNSVYIILPLFPPPPFSLPLPLSFSASPSFSRFFLSHTIIFYIAQPLVTPERLAFSLKLSPSACVCVCLRVRVCVYV